MHMKELYILIYMKKIVSSIKLIFGKLFKFCNFFLIPGNYIKIKAQSYNRYVGITNISQPKEIKCTRYGEHLWEVH